MRVALFSRNAKAADAIGQQVAAKVRYFQKLGETRLYLSESTALHPVCQSLPPFILSASALWKDPEHREYLLSCDLVMAEFGSAYDLLDLLPALSGQGPRIIVNYRGLTPLEFAEPALHPEISAAQRQRALLWAADLVIADSEYAAQELQVTIGMPQERMQVLPCYLEPLPNAGELQTRREFRRQHGLEFATLLLFVGRLAANKQPEMLIEALPRLRQWANPPYVVFVGECGDAYAGRKAFLTELSNKLGVSDRIRFTGQVSPKELNQWYQAADAVILPSLHECFGLPVAEAQARGIPVICGDRGALPETLGHAGLTFQAANKADFVDQLERLFAQPAVIPQAKKIAVVTHRFGFHFAGGAEVSLRRMAQTLQGGGWDVEIFTTCNERESRWENTQPAGTFSENGLTIHRFPIDAYSQERLDRAYEKILRSEGEITEAVQRDYLRNSLGSEALLESLSNRRDEFAAVLVGPYLFKLTCQVVSALGQQVILVPCFHDEPLAKLATFHAAYRHVGGMIFHSAGESQFTATNLKLNHPRSQVVNTLLPDSAFQLASSARSPVSEAPYLVYCGRYCPEKGLTELLDWMERTVANVNSPLKLVCMGNGPMRLPRKNWLVDLGFVTEDRKREVLQGALALVNLSRQESLSLVVLEAWAQKIPVLVNKTCLVLREQIRRSGAGVCLLNQSELEGTVRRWLEDRQLPRFMGEAGWHFVKQHYANPEQYLRQLEESVASLSKPLRELAGRKGLEQACEKTQENWERQMSELLDAVAQKNDFSDQSLQIHSTLELLEIATDSPGFSITVQIGNPGSTVVACSGPARVRLLAEVRSEDRILSRSTTKLEAALGPGQEEIIVAACRSPRRLGNYQVRFALIQGKANCPRVLAEREIALIVKNAESGSGKFSNQPGALSYAVEKARQCIHSARRLEQLPEDYLDVTEGRFARFKKWVKFKLLNNFRRAYVDVAFQQQSALNQKLIAAISLLLDALQSRTQQQDFAELVQRIEALERQFSRNRQKRRRQHPIPGRGAVAGTKPRRGKAS